jgi:DNA-binding transcriptional ArsR family regulator
MPRAATTTDVFNAVAEPRRRRILDFLARGEQPVNAVVESLRMGQPQVSKHLGVLKQVGLVSVRGAGRQRLYRLNAEGLKPIHDWVKAYETLWADRLDRLDDYLQRLQSEGTHDDR